MREILGPPLRGLAFGAFIIGLTLMLVASPFSGGLGGLLKVIGVAALIILVVGWLTVLLAGETMPEPEFRRLVDRSEALAKLPVPDYPPSEFDELVMRALDDLPEEFQRILEDTPVVVSQLGHEHRAYGLYMGDTVARDGYPDRIVIYQDTLERDFGHDP